MVSLLLVPPRSSGENSPIKDSGPSEPSQQQPIVRLRRSGEAPGNGAHQLSKHHNRTQISRLLIPMQLQNLWNLRNQRNGDRRTLEERQQIRRTERRAEQKRRSDYHDSRGQCNGQRLGG